MKRIVRNETPSTNKASDITFKEKDAKVIEILAASGKTVKEIGEYFNISESSMMLNLRRDKNLWVRERYRMAISNLVASAGESLEKMAKGYTYTEKEYKGLLKPEWDKKFIEDNKELLIGMLELGRYEEFTRFIVEYAIIPDTDTIKVYEKFSKADLGAARDILRTHSPDTWDLEAKHKKIPQMKIVVKVQDEPKFTKRIPATYTVEA